MDLAPDFDAFAQGWAAGQNQLVTIRLAADLDTPVSLMLKLAEAAPLSFMLESVTGGEIRGRVVAVVAAGAGRFGDGAGLVEVADRANGAACGARNVGDSHDVSVNYDAA